MSYSHNGINKNGACSNGSTHKTECPYENLFTAFIRQSVCDYVEGKNATKLNPRSARYYRYQAARRWLFDDDGLAVWIKEAGFGELIRIDVIRAYSERCARDNYRPYFRINECEKRRLFFDY